MYIKIEYQDFICGSNGIKYMVDCRKLHRYSNVAGKMSPEKIAG